jgi:signal transduction protein with GAF and PtsI domain
MPSWMVVCVPMSVDEVHQVLRELDDLRYSAGNLDEALRLIVKATHRLFAVDGAGLMLIDPDQLLRNVAVSDRRVHHLEGLQIEHGEGPCVDAFEEKAMADADDLKGENRWPLFSPAAVERGLRAVLASPIPYNQHAIGVVVVFSGKARPWSPEGKLALIAFTDLAALTIANTGGVRAPAPSGPPSAAPGRRGHGHHPTPDPRRRRASVRRPERRSPDWFPLAFLEARR